MENTTEKKSNVATEDAEVKIVNKDPIPFKQSTATEYVTSTEFCELVNSVFAGLYADYYGCRIMPSPINGVLELSLIFKHDDNSDKLQATYKITDKVAEDKKDNKILDAINLMQTTAYNRKVYDLSSTAKKALAPFMIPENGFMTNNNEVFANTVKANRKENGINWNARIVLQNADNTQYVEVRYVSPEGVMGLVHGTDIDGHKVQYKVSVDRPIGINPFGPYVPSQKYLIKIEQGDVNEVAELMSKVNCYAPMVNGSLTNVVRA